MSHDYELIDHTYDVVVVGAGGAGLRATLGMAAAGLSTACITKVFPTRSHTVAAQGGMSASLGNMGADDWRWHMYDTVKGSDWLGDQDAIEYMCREAVPAVIELEHYGVPFSRTEEGKIYQRPFGGMTTNFGEGTAQRTCAAADRTGHAILHTLYQQSLKHRRRVLHRVLRPRPDHGRTASAAACWPGTWTTAQLHRFRAHMVVLATGGYGRAYFSVHLGAHLHRRRQRHGAARRPAAAGHGVRAVPSDRHLRRRRADHRGRARRGRLSDQFRRRALHGALCAQRQGSRVARRGQPLDDHRDSRRPRRRSRQRPHPSASRTSGRRRDQRTPARHRRDRPRSSPASTSPANRSRCCRPCTTTWAAFRPTITARSSP